MSGRMPFGKYRGWPLAELPDSYLRWLFTIAVREPLASALVHEAARRAGRWRQEERLAARPVPIDQEVAEALVMAGYRALAQRHHPDVGGELEMMKRVNLTAEALRHLLVGRKAQG